MPLSIRVEGLQRLAGRMGTAGQRLQTETQIAMQKSVLLIEGTARELAPRDTGRLGGSISSRITGRGATLLGEVGPSVKYGFWVERGRRPGKLPPIAAVAGWARRHGMSPFLVARAIGRRGTRPQPYMWPAWQRNETRIRDLFREVGRVVSAHLGGT